MIKVHNSITFSKFCSVVVSSLDWHSEGQLYETDGSLFLHTNETFFLPSRTRYIRINHK